MLDGRSRAIPSLQQRCQLRLVLIVGHQPPQRRVACHGRVEVDLALAFRQFGQTAGAGVAASCVRSRRCRSSGRWSPCPPRAPACAARLSSGTGRVRRIPPVCRSAPEPRAARPGHAHGRGRIRGRWRASAGRPSGAGACACARPRGRAAGRSRRRQRTAHGSPRRAGGGRAGGSRSRCPGATDRPGTSRERPPDPGSRPAAARRDLRSRPGAARRGGRAARGRDVRHPRRQDRRPSRLAACRTPARCARSTASLTDSVRPKSSAVNTTRCIQDARRIARSAQIRFGRGRHRVLRMPRMIACGRRTGKVSLEPARDRRHAARNVPHFGLCSRRHLIDWISFSALPRTLLARSTPLRSAYSSPRY